LIVTGGIIELFTALAKAMDWEGLREWWSELSTGEKVKEIIELFAGLMIVIGLILLFTGVGTGVGVFLLVTGGILELFTAMDIDWDAMLESLKGAWNRVKEWFEGHVKQFLTAEYWLDVAKSLGEGFLNGIETAFNKVVDFVSGIVDSILSMIESVANAISSLFNEGNIGGGGYSSGGGATRSFSTGSTIYSFDAADFSIPALANGAVLPANQPFLAMVGDQTSGTNIETPLSTMVDAFEIAMAKSNTRMNTGDTTVVLELDGTRLGKAIVNLASKESKRVGTRLSY